MATYLYQIVETGEEIEVEHSVNAKPLTVLEHEGRLVSVRRLISGSSNFVLKGGCWSRDGFEKGLQSSPKDKP